MKMRLFISAGLFFAGVFIISGCDLRNQQAVFVDAAIAEVQASFAPDRRVARFDVEADIQPDKIVLIGETNLPDARNRLLEMLDTLAYTVDDQIIILPESALGAVKWGIVKNSVANLRSSPGHSAELVSQALLGTPMNILKKDGGFYLVQTPDGYLGWVSSSSMQPVDELGLAQYREVNKVIYLYTQGFAYDTPREAASRVGDLVAGSIIEVVGEQNGYYETRYPDGRIGYIKKVEAMPYAQWIGDVQITESSLVDTARDLMGVPYLWGGTSTKGVDCSGFTKTVYFLNGVILPRDASQQVRTGVSVDEQGDFSRHAPGDLLFFGRAATDSTRERVVHVGMWIGDGTYIHSSGRVRINSMNPADSNYDDYNRNRYLRTKRILHQEAGVHHLKDDGLFSAISE